MSTFIIILAILGAVLLKYWELKLRKPVGVRVSRYIYFTEEFGPKMQINRIPNDKGDYTYLCIFTDKNGKEVLIILHSKLENSVSNKIFGMDTKDIMTYLGTKKFLLSNGAAIK